MKFILSLFSLLIIFCSSTQIVPNNGVKESKLCSFALTNVTIFVSPEKTLTNATLLIHGDEIIKVGTKVKIPDGTVIIDCTGKTILPSFIELNSTIGLPEVQKKKSREYTPQLESLKEGAYYWNESIHPEIHAGELYTIDKKGIEEYQLRGFGFALTHQNDGIARGNAAFVALDDRNVHKNLTNWTTAGFFSFDKGTSNQTYPSSQMGSIALLRQAIYDARWYHDSKAQKERNLSLEALYKQLDSSLFFHTTDKWEILRAQKIADEFKIKFHFLGSGNEYQIVDQLKNFKSTIVIPMDFPKVYDVKNPYIAKQIPLSELKHWEMAPANAAILARNGVSFCISATNHKSSEEFWSHLRQAIKVGLTESQALKALTTEPAKVLGVHKLIGTLEPGMKASFTIYDGNPFTSEATILESWNLGQQKVFNELQKNDVRGNYNILVENRRFPLELSGSKDKPKGKIKTGIKSSTSDGKSESKEILVFVSLIDNDITLQFNVQDSIWNGSVNLQGKVNTKLGVFEGEGMLPNGKWVKWSAIKNGNFTPSTLEKIETNKDSLTQLWFPNVAFGYDSIPKKESLVIKNATIWTNEAEGILKNATLIIDKGKIVSVGTEPHKFPKDARIIDANGKHVTCGIIDEHSHIAISKGVNESGQSISAEVSIGDVIDPDDINIYRQLAGGVTCSQLLHGSANPIGGQSALIKLKWGHSPQEMLIQDAPKFIKFALGENVKQSNWGDFNTVRFPQTRMGVEQVFYDGFLRAVKYQESWKEYKLGKSKIQPRIDLELEVLSEILNAKRFITCHSYVQSEILMLMQLADSLGFKINTFTHILEGYKVADEMAKHGVGGSTFADWWAYKYEVNDAIPYNAKIMHDRGIVVAINSDDAEMGRRLNQEAAKCIKYGNMSEEEAWKLVTLNPAKLLHLDDRMGSLKVGKDADVVIWSTNPLSIQAKVEYTIVDGAILYDSNLNERLNQRNQMEKARIISKMLDDNQSKNEEAKAFTKKRKRHFCCDTIGEEGTLEENMH